MKFFIVDLLACPVCKSRDLLLYPIEVMDEDSGPDPEKVKCKNYCHYKNMPASQVPLEVCRECVRKRIVTGVIVCKKCGRWYPIEDTIAYMLDDKYRDDKYYAKWFEKHGAKIPDSIKGLMRIPPVNRVEGVEGGG